MQGESRMLAIGKKGSIARQILFPLLLLIVGSNIVVVSIIMRQLDAQLLLAAQHKLNQISQLQDIKFTSNINELVNDVLIVSRTAPIKAIANNDGSKDIGVSGELSIEAWKSQLARICTEILNFKERYDQIRLILADGSEWLRVDRRGDENSIHIVPANDLQNKYSMSYFQETIKLQLGEVYLSEIELNREFGVVSKPEKPVIRASTPLYADDGKLFGILIFNENLQNGFDELHALAGDDTNVLLSNSAGEYILHPEENKRFQFEYGQSSSIFGDYPAAKYLLADMGNSFETGIADKGNEQQVYSLRTIVYGSGAPGNRLIVATSYDLSSALQVKSHLLKQIYFLLILITVIAVLLSIIVARRIAKPIVRMRDALTDQGLNTQSTELPLSSSGEVGDLARVFEQFITELSRRQKILHVEVQERKSAQAELEENNKKLVSLNREMEQFAYIASHDLQEPLRTVASFVDLLVEHNAEQQDEQVKVFHGFILDSVQRMRDLVTALLDYSRLGADSKREKIDCQQLLNEVCEDLGARIEDAQAEIHYSDLPRIDGKRTELRMLFQNMISNGMKFSRQDVRPCIHISAKRGSGEWVFCVQDNGIGISPEHFDKIFNIFQRLHNRDDFDGAGIGLAHCKKIVQMHSGKIWLESSLGEGSAFYFSLRDIDNG
ncbi:ATP-binding protein [Zhongshania aliphaticivorans]|uniref:ATP-binding protein n=1 Tax=Zhongshania aliphaticivorans TaxID=1470434 RepID=UPI0012E441D3|nr:ATP-binding protein [Zhongshania aliphaticivorans]CAA0102908.1 Phytochrome-like protein cph1 [Zhongshania aliphaticivorans]